jgi:hypothetical protein
MMAAFLDPEAGRLSLLEDMLILLSDSGGPGRAGRLPAQQR